jgi:recombination protein RecR
MNTLQKLTSFFAEFPGIGPRQAKRFVYFLLTRNQTHLNEISDLIKKIKQEMQMCTSCYRFFFKNHSESIYCDICINKNRDSSLLTIVSRDTDFENIEKTGIYNGKYFILGGSVPILEKNPENKIRIKELLRNIEIGYENGLKEIIFALNANPEGENTTDYIKKIISPITEKYNIKTSTLGRGLSTGTELEYSDSETLKNALTSRTTIK